MDDAPPARLEHLFERIDVLGPPARLELSRLLTPPASLPAVLAQEIASLPIPPSRTVDLGGAVRTVFENALGPSELAALRPLALSDIVPSIKACSAGGILAGGPARIRELLRRQGIASWADLADVTLGEMAEWTNVGPSTLAVLIAGAVEAALASSTSAGGGAGEGEPERSPPVADPSSEALALLVHHERVTGTDGLRLALEALAGGDRPPEVRTAAARLLEAAKGAGNPQLVALGAVWEAAGDHRDRSIFAYRALRLDRRLSTKALGQVLGVSEQRVQQLQARAELRARDAAAASPIPALAGELGERLGPACRVAAIDRALAGIGLPPHDDARSAVLVWLAGPYVPVKAHGGWVATDPATLVAETRRLLHLDGGVRALDHVAADLETAGVAADDLEDWLAGQDVVLLDGLIVTRSGSPADVAERLLAATGKAMTAGELAALADATAAPGSATILDGRLRRDGRFIRVDRDHFELAEWGGAPFREPRQPTPAERFPGTGRAATTGRSQLRIDVDAAVLRGATATVPHAVVDSLGIACGGRRTFTTRYGPVALSRTADQPSRGSVRPVALAAGARSGDLLVIDFDAATGNASVEVVLAARAAAS